MTFYVDSVGRCYRDDARLSGNLDIDLMAFRAAAEKIIDELPLFAARYPDEFRYIVRDLERAVGVALGYLQSSRRGEPFASPDQSRSSA